MPSHQTLVPTLRYEDANEAIRWLANAFGLTEHCVVRNHDGQVEHAQVDELFERCRAAGARVVQPVVDTEYVSHAFTVADYEDNHWHIGTYDPLAESAGEDCRRVKAPAAHSAYLRRV